MKLPHPLEAKKVYSVGLDSFSEDPDCEWRVEFFIGSNSFIRLYDSIMEIGIFPGVIASNTEEIGHGGNSGDVMITNLVGRMPVTEFNSMRPAILRFVKEKLSDEPSVDDLLFILNSIISSVDEVIQFIANFKIVTYSKRAV